jgi:hypothetical protein
MIEVMLVQSKGVVVMNHEDVSRSWKCRAAIVHLMMTIQNMAFFLHEKERTSMYCMWINGSSSK